MSIAQRNGVAIHSVGVAISPLSTMETAALNTLTWLSSRTVSGS